SSECAALFKSFVASTSLKGLYLFVLMTPSDMESVLNSMDVSRLEEILLRAKGYSSPQVDCVLDCLTNAHNLQNTWDEIKQPSASSGSTQSRTAIVSDMEALAIQELIWTSWILTPTNGSIWKYIGDCADYLAPCCAIVSVAVQDEEEIESTRRHSTISMPIDFEQ
ncbi:hypothetical protein BGX31_003980, partial [Mortierella sp. GBA43]